MAPRKKPVKFDPVLVPLDDLTPHPDNYRFHSEFQVDAIAESIRINGMFRNVVTAKDHTILAGHGVALAARKLNLAAIPVIVLPILPDSDEARRVLIADNELGRLADSDDRQLTELLRDLRDSPEALTGTGFDDEQLTALLMLTRHDEEIGSKQVAREWVGMPEYDSGDNFVKLIVTFADPADREKFVKEKKLEIDSRGGSYWSTRWPWTERYDRASVRFVEAE
jgi:hypothetical protein